MTRLRADLALGFAGLIWGFGFVAQKTALDHIGPFTFVAVRFLISALAVLPLVLYEKKSLKTKEGRARKRHHIGTILVLCATFAAAVLFQQYGLTATTVTSTAFLTGLYVVITPFAGYLLYRHKLSVAVVAASILALFGIWLLAGGNPGNLKIGFGMGDGLVLLCALCFALQVAIMGQVAGLLRAPFFLSFVQYLATGLVALALALLYEHMDLDAILGAWIPILYAGIASGGIAYTLQAIAQQHTPAADTAIILSSEALFGGLGGVLIMKDRLTAGGVIGCAAIMAAIVLVEIGPLWRWGKKRRQGKSARA